MYPCREQQIPILIFYYFTKPSFIFWLKTHYLFPIIPANTFLPRRHPRCKPNDPIFIFENTVYHSKLKIVFIDDIGIIQKTAKVFSVITINAIARAEPNIPFFI